MTLAFLMHPNTVVTGRVCRKGERSVGKDRGGKRIICRARRPFFHAIFHHERARRERERKKRSRLGETRVENEERSGKRRRGAYQRHLLIYFAPVGRSRRREGILIRICPYHATATAAAWMCVSTAHWGYREKERRRTRFIPGEIYSW